MRTSVPSQAERYTRLRSYHARQARDPGSSYRFAVPRLREAFGLFTAPDPIDELHLRACNVGGKTLAEAMYVVRCAQKQRELDGVPIPQWRGPVECAQLVLDYKQQVLSVQPAYLRALGKWPYKPRYQGAALESLHVMPVGGDPDDTSDWSPIHFLSQKNMQTGTGVRGDVIAFDEPPRMDILRELRKAAHAGRRGIRLIGETPTKRSQWWPLLEDYGDTPRRTLRRVDKARAECRWSLDEVASWVLSAERKAALRADYARDPLGDAREHGDYMNTDGACPFDMATLLAMLGECVTPDIRAVRVAREAVGGVPHGVITLDCEIFAPPARGAEYYAVIDPASGTETGSHHFAGLHIYKAGTVDLAMRWVGHVAPYSLGVLGATLGREYNDAWVDVETKDHWAVNVYRGLERSGYGKLCYETRKLADGKVAREAGFDNDKEIRADIIGQVQEWVEAWRAGVRYASMPSRDVIGCLMDARLDDRGMIVAGDGQAHGVDMVLFGQALRRAFDITEFEEPELYEPVLTNRQRLARRIKGEDIESLPYASLEPKRRT